MGRLTGKIRRGNQLPKESRLHKTAEFGPQVKDEYLYRVIDALDEVAEERGRPFPILRQLALQRPTVVSVIIGARNGSSCGRIWAPQAGISRPSRWQDLMRPAT